MDEENVWYINDEVGCAMRHSDKPNFAMHPFIYAPNHVIDGHTITYSVLYNSLNFIDLLASRGY